MLPLSQTSKKNKKNKNFKLRNKQSYINTNTHNTKEVIVRTRFDLNPKREWIQAYVAQTMNLQSAGKKASLILGQNIGFQCKKIKDTSMECSNKSLRTCPRDLIFSFSSCSGVPFFFCLSSPYIPWLFFLFLSSTCGPGIQRPFSSSPLPSLESSILSWKAVRSLFRYHLHINAARRLAGRHLMRR